MYEAEMNKTGHNMESFNRVVDSRSIVLQITGRVPSAPIWFLFSALEYRLDADQGQMMASTIQVSTDALLSAQMASAIFKDLGRQRPWCFRM